MIEKHQQKSLAGSDQSLVELLVAKDNELKEGLKQAEEQAKIEQQMDELRAQGEKQDEEINQLQKQLKDAEQILSTALFQARQKLASINRANKRPVSSEELIKFAHRISATHSICAPLQWQQGDLGRPYPTDTEIRRGHLGKADLSINGHNLQHQTSLNDMHRNTTGGGAVPAATQNQFAWHSSGELHMAMGGGSVSLETRQAEAFVFHFFVFVFNHLLLSFQSSQGGVARGRGGHVYRVVQFQLERFTVTVHPHLFMLSVHLIKNNEYLKCFSHCLPLLPNQTHPLLSYATLSL